MYKFNRFARDSHKFNRFARDSPYLCCPHQLQVFLDSRIFGVIFTHSPCLDLKESSWQEQT